LRQGGSKTRNGRRRSGNASLAHGVVHSLSGALRVIELVLAAVLLGEKIEGTTNISKARAQIVDTGCIREKHAHV